MVSLGAIHNAWICKSGRLVGKSLIQKANNLELYTDLFFNLHKNPAQVFENKGDLHNWSLSKNLQQINSR